MECKVCQNPINATYSFCPYCGNSTTKHNNTGHTITTGNNSVNFGLGNNSKQEFFISNFNVAKETDELIVKYDYRLDHKVNSGLKGFKLKFEISGILSIVSALITLIDYLYTKSDFTFLFILIALGFLIYAFDSKGKFEDLKKYGIVYKQQTPILFNNNGEIYKVKKYGICPICKGKVYISNDDKFKKHFGICDNNRDHIYTYDHTIEAGVPIEVLRLTR
ncbi:hypothetical protein [Bacillus haynesii]|uniref:hypothetical protein n=1 Tax=Bacillus haynesii TaxID=1925021 RepID=UPI00228207BD|nr:hypothetical protein [Bacillus haynesii]MCY8379583.1 hypothetical protein [Bacillus haynesii]MEC0674174.1 hypothetical protein [Bacillus haynesii]